MQSSMFTVPRPNAGAAAAAALLAVFALSAGNASARPPLGGSGPGTSMLEGRIRHLDLDTATRDAVFAILDGSRPTEREIESRLDTEHASMRALLEQDSPDEAAVLAQADRVGQTMLELRKQQLRTLLAVRSQLTPEQRAELAPPDGKGGHDGHGFRGGCSGPKD